MKITYLIGGYYIFALIYIAMSKFINYATNFKFKNFHDTLANFDHDVNLIYKIILQMTQRTWFKNYKFRIVHAHCRENMTENLQTLYIPQFE